jgi:hypothetical protein
MAFRNTSASPGVAFDAPVPLVAQSVVGGNTSLVFPGAFNPGLQLIDVSQYQSMFVRYVPNPASVTISVVFTWFPYSIVPSGGAATDSVGIDVFRWSSGDHLELMKPLACRGNGLFISINRTGGSAPNTDFVRIYGSNRPVDPGMLIPMDSVNDGADRIIMSSTGSISANNNTTINSSVRYDGPAQVSVQTFPSLTQPLRFELFDLTSGALLFGGAGPITNGVSYLSQRMVIARNSISAVLYNDNGTSASYRLLLIADPES